MSIVGYNATNGMIAAGATALAAAEVARGTSSYAPALAALASSASWKALCMAGALGLVRVFAPPDPLKKIIDRLPEGTVQNILQNLSHKNRLRYLKLFPNNPDVQAAAHLPLICQTARQRAKDLARLIKAKQILKTTLQRALIGMDPGIMGALGGARAIKCVLAAGALGTANVFTLPDITPRPFLSRLLAGISLSPVIAGGFTPNSETLIATGLESLVINGIKLGYDKLPSDALRQTTMQVFTSFLPWAQLIKTAAVLTIPIRRHGMAAILRNFHGRFELLHIATTETIQSQIARNIRPAQWKDGAIGALAGAVVNVVGASFLNPTSPYHYSLNFVSMAAGALAARLFNR